MKKMIILAVLMVAGLFSQTNVEAQVAEICIISKPVLRVNWISGPNGSWTLDCRRTGSGDCDPNHY